MIVPRTSVVDVELERSLKVRPTKNPNTKQKTKVPSVNIFNDVDIYGGFNRPLSTAVDIFIFLLLICVCGLQALFCADGINVAGSLSIWDKMLVLTSLLILCSYWAARE